LFLFFPKATPKEPKHKHVLKPRGLKDLIYGFKKVGQATEVFNFAFAGFREDAFCVTAHQSV
jgi:hypothetical protein